MCLRTSSSILKVIAQTNRHTWPKHYYQKFEQTRMHSSRMRTARCSSRLDGVSTRYPPGAGPHPPTLDQAPPTGADPNQAHPPDQAHTPRSRPSTDQAHPPPRPGTPQEQTPPGPGTPPVDRHTPVNILPCPKLRLRAVIKAMFSQINTVFVSSQFHAL